jgi:hypothetical protein
MTLGIDYSAWAAPSGAVVAADGWRFVCRYLSWLGNSKNLKPEELADMHAHGVAVVLVFETTRYRAVDGFDAGKFDAGEALDQARRLGWPGDRPIYFAVDFDVIDLVCDPVWSYFEGVAAVLGRQRVGVYGSYYVVKRMLDTGFTYAWQTTAWSHGQRDPRMNLFQRAEQVTVDGVECDVNEALTPDFGQWPYNTGGFLMALTDAEQAEALRYLRRMVMGETGVNPAGDQFLGEMAWRDATTAQLNAIQGTLSTEEADLLAAIKAPGWAVDTKALATALTGAGLPAQIVSALLAVLNKAAVGV